MKTIFTLLSSLLISMAVIANPGDKTSKFKSQLTIRSAERGDIRVVIDGRRFEPNRNYMRMQNLKPGYHRIKIYREKRNGLFDIFGRRYEVVYNSSLFIRPRTSIMLFVDRFGKTTVNERRINDWYSRDDRRYDDPNNRRFDDDDNFDFKADTDDWDRGNWDKGNEFDFDRDGRLGDYDTDRDNRNFDDRSFKNTMSEYDFSNVLRSMEKEWFENNRVKSASQIISSNYFTTAQVKQLLQLFTFENNKLDLAKQAYGKTIDQRNYYMINDVFSFSSSKDELSRFIRNSR